jgi:ornithine cyclodeaminase/alanine dehydrogenase-like protein (mu-crystallin family)
VSVLYLTEDDVRQLLDMDTALAAVEAAFRKLALDEAVNVPRQRCQTDHVMLHVLPAAAKTLGVAGYKAYVTTKHGARFHVTLYDGKTGDMTAILQADYLGQMRTGAASGVATKLLARADAQTVGLYGTGKQARTQLLAVCKVRPVKRVSVYSRDEARRKQFAGEMSRECGTEVVPVGTPAEAGGADIVITATSSRDPVLQGAWLKDGTHLNLIGSNFLAKTEADVEVFRRATLVAVDSKEQSKPEAGDFVAAYDQGVLHISDVLELAPLLVGRYPGRETPQDITVFKSLGLGIEDIAVAAKVVAKAKEKGVGKVLEV